MPEFVKPSYTELAAMCRAPAQPSRATDGVIFRTLQEVEGDVWSDLFGDEDIWHRRDPEDRAAWDAPALYTRSFDVALATRTPGIPIVGMDEPSKPGDPWRVVLLLPIAGSSFNGYGVNPAMALLNAFFLVLAYIHDENGARTKAAS